MESHNNILIMPLWVNLRLKIVMFVSYALTLLNKDYLLSLTALTKATNKGCGFATVLLYSG